jgi:hypothetical protein
VVAFAVDRVTVAAVVTATTAADRDRIARPARVACVGVARLDVRIGAGVAAVTRVPAIATVRVTATPTASAFASPELPDVAVEVTLPVSPDFAYEYASPCLEYEKLNAGPELPDEAYEPATESPLSAFASGFAVALPELPVLPETATGAATESPDLASPAAMETESA